MKPEPSILAKSWFLNRRVIFFDLLLPSDMEYHILIKNFLNSRILNPKRSSYLELRCRTEKDVPLLDLSQGDEFILHFPERSFFINVERMHFWNKLKTAEGKDLLVRFKRVSTRKVIFMSLDIKEKAED